MFKYTEKKFAKDVGRVAESIDPSLSYKYLPDAREVELTSSKDGAEGPYTIFLGNIYLKVVDLPKKERRQAIEAFLREVLVPQELTPDELMASLALRVRTDFEIDFRKRHIELMGHDAPPSIALRRGDLLIEVVSDRDETVMIARSDDLAEIGVDEDEAFRMAAAKIRRGTGEDQWQTYAESIWISAYQDDYDFARLVAAEDFGKFPFDGVPIVFAPSHSICLATDSTDADVLTKMVDAGNELAASHRPFCQLLWARADGSEWQEWTPDAGDNAAQVAELQVLRETLKQYEEAKHYLERSLGGEDVFVGTFEPIQVEDRLSCYCVYTCGIPSYLPRTDFVAVVDLELPNDQSLMGRVDWAEFEDIFGSELLQPVDDMAPPWYRLLQPLDDTRKDRLRKAARPL